MSFKVIALLLASTIILSPIVAHASTQTWTSQSDWGNWTMSQTTNTITSGSLTLNAASASWSSETDSHIGSNANQNILTASFYGDGLRRFYVPNAPYLFEITWGGSSWDIVATNSPSNNGIPNIGTAPRVIGDSIYYVGQGGDCTNGLPLIKLSPGVAPGDTFTSSQITYIHGTPNGESSCALGGPPTIGPGGSVILTLGTSIDWEPSRSYIVEYKASSWRTLHTSIPGWSYSGFGYGNGRGDGTDRLYFGADAGFYELPYDSGSDSWGSVSLISGSERPSNIGNTIVFGTVGDNTTDTRMYAVGSNVYEYNYSGSSWTVTDIGDGIPAYGNTLALGDGRGDGVNRLYFNTGIVDGEKTQEASLSGSTWTLADAGFGGSRNGGGESFGGLYLSFAGDSRNDGSGSVIAGDFYETKYTVSTYNTPGYASINFDGTNTYSEWQTLTKSETTNSQTIAYYGASDTDTSCPTAGAPWTGWTALSFSGNDADLTGLTHTRYLCLGVNLSTADTAVTPQVDALTLTYRQDTAPTVTISSPTNQATYITNTTPITVSGSSSDSVGTLSTTTSSSGASNTGTAASWSFSEPLVEGDNALTYTATDNVTQTGTDSFTATLDTIDPVVTITSGTTSSTASYTLTGTATDTGGTGVASVAVSGASAGNGTASGTTSWSQTVTLATGANTITVTATDNATNTGSGSITVTYTPTPPPDEPCYWDSNTNNCADYFGTFTITAPNGGESYTVGSGDGEVTTASITWTYVSGSETADHVHLYYSTDGGVTYPNTITSSTPVSPATYTWTLPTDLTSSTVKVKGVIEDSSSRQSSALDASDADFSIAQAATDQENCDLTAPTVADCGDDDTLWGTFTITAPNGTECFLTGVGLLIPSCLPTTVSTTTNITWEYTQGTIEADHLKLAYSTDNGITWYSITENTPLSPASYTWTLPTLSSTQMIISGTLTDSTGDTISSDSSDAPFTIRNNRAPEIRVR